MQRHERLEQDVKIALSDIILNEVKEPSVTGLISVTDVKITPDQKYAKVYISIFGKQNKTKVIEAGMIYTGTVSRIMSFGAFVDLGGGNEGLLHISKISSKRVEKVEDVLNVGDEVTVKVSEIDEQGRINLNMKDLEAGN